MMGPSTRREVLRSRLKTAAHFAAAALAAAFGKPFLRRLKKAAAWSSVPEAEIERIEFDRGMAGEIRRFTNPGPEFEELDISISESKRPRVKALAYYLPQFHEIPENNEWWGKGFTEWRNVARGAPRFRGHYQPRIPRDLGHYTLSDTSIIKRQVEYAKTGGIYGFCFYYYWFGGKKLLYRPIDIFLNDSTIDINFCLMWANDNWTRRWDGQDRHILLAQDYEKHDDAEFVEDLHKYFQDSRYIRINGRPLFVVYRPDIVAKMTQKISEWRELCYNKYKEDPLFFIAQTGTLDPSLFGMDGAIEFPPHKLMNGLRPISASLSLFDDGFQGKAYSYDALADAAMREPRPDFPLIKAACPDWDNDARRIGAGTVFHGSTPRKYEAWLKHCVDFALENPVYSESFVGINAWNEWAEGAYLEPDVYYGAAYLNATARALRGNSHDTQGLSHF